MAAASLPIMLIFVATALSLHAATAKPSQTRLQSSRFLKQDTTAVDDGTPGFGGNGGGQTKNPRAADHCNKDDDPGLCRSLYGEGFECCNNKCIDVAADKQNCGGCKNKCAFKDECCGGECVYLSLDKRHCGKCDSPCAGGELCVYGLCNYA